MEMTIDDDHVEDRLRIGAGEANEIKVALPRRLQIACRNASKPLLYVDTPAGQLPVKASRSHAESFEILSDRIAGASFRAKVHFPIDTFSEVAQQFVRL